MSVPNEDALLANLHGEALHPNIVWLLSNRSNIQSVPNDGAHPNIRIVAYVKTQRSHFLSDDGNGSMSELAFLKEDKARLMFGNH